MITVFSDSLENASPLILQAMREYQRCTVEVFIESELQGYTARLKQCQTPTDEMTASQLKRAMRMYKSPQTYDVKLEPWPMFMYRGLHRGEKSSAF